MMNDDVIRKILLIQYQTVFRSFGIDFAMTLLVAIYKEEMRQRRLKEREKREERRST
jgi:hypothetical protein